VTNVSYSCLSTENLKFNLNNKRIVEVFEISETNEREMLIYFKPGFEAIIFKMELPIIKEEVVIYYKILVDVKSKFIISFKTQNITDNTQIIDLGSKICNQVFKELGIYTKNAKVDLIM